MDAPVVHRGRQNTTTQREGGREKREEETRRVNKTQTRTYLQVSQKAQTQVKDGDDEEVLEERAKIARSVQLLATRIGAEPAPVAAGQGARQDRAVGKHQAGTRSAGPCPGAAVQDQEGPAAGIPDQDQVDRILAEAVVPRNQAHRAGGEHRAGACLAGACLAEGRLVAGSPAAWVVGVLEGWARRLAEETACAGLGAVGRAAGGWARWLSGVGHWDQAMLHLDRGGTRASGQGGDQEHQERGREHQAWRVAEGSSLRP